MVEYQADLIYDIGLNTGQDAEFYLKKNFRVVGVEANPVIAQKAAERLARFGSRLLILKYGIGPEEQEVCPFYVNRRYHEQSTFLQEYSTGPTWDLGYDVIQVPVKTIHPVLAEYGVPYYMKIDIEARDLLVLEQLLATRARPKYISVETGPTTQWIDALEALGYRGFKLVDQTKHSNVALPNPAKEGRYVEHSFEWGSSGPFGDEIASPWETAETIRMLWRSHINRGFPDGCWFDVHARWP